MNHLVLGSQCHQPSFQRLHIPHAVIQHQLGATQTRLLLNQRQRFKHLRPQPLVPTIHDQQLKLRPVDQRLGQPLELDKMRRLQMRRSRQSGLFRVECRGGGVHGATGGASLSARW